MNGDMFGEDQEPVDPAMDALRREFAGPQSSAYWDGLHGRIMAGLHANPETWWVVMSGWTRVGIAAAAAVVVMAAGLATVATRDAEARAAYQLVILEGPGKASPLDQALNTPGISQREAAFRFLVPQR